MSDKKENQEVIKKTTKIFSNVKETELSSVSDIVKDKEEINFIDIKTVQYTLHYMDAELTAKFIFYGEDDGSIEYFEFNPCSGWGHSFAQGWCEQDERDNEIQSILCILSNNENLCDLADMCEENDIGKIYEYSVEGLVDESDLEDDFDRTYKLEIDDVSIEKEVIY